MKEKDIDILTLQDVEELCRLYLDCQLSLLEEKELQYVLLRLNYSSPIIEEARTSMAAESLFQKKKKISRSRGFKWRPGITWAAASIAVILGVSLIIGMQDHVNKPETNLHNISQESSENIIIAYEGGKKLNPAESELAVKEAILKADKLMAMAQAKVKQDEYKQNHIIQLTSKEK